MPIEVIAQLVPANNGLFPTHASQYGLGGWHEVLTLADRDAIPIQRRTAGMAVNVITLNVIFTLGQDLQTWAEIVLTGIEEAPLDAGLYVRSNGAWIDIGGSFDAGLYA